MCVAIPARVMSIEGDTATVEVGGSETAARLDALEDVKVGDYVLVHAGFAITKVDEDQARETLELMREVGML